MRPPVANSLEEAVVERNLLPVGGRLRRLVAVEEEEARGLLVDLHRPSVQLPNLVLHRQRPDLLDGLCLSKVDLSEMRQSIDLHRSFDFLQWLVLRNLVLFAFTLQDQEVDDGFFRELRLWSWLELEDPLRLWLIDAFRRLVRDIEELKECLFGGRPDSRRDILMYRDSERSNGWTLAYSPGDHVQILIDQPRLPQIQLSQLVCIPYDLAHLLDH